MDREKKTNKLEQLICVLLHFALKYLTIYHSIQFNSIQFMELGIFLEGDHKEDI